MNLSRIQDVFYGAEQDPLELWPRSLKVSYHSLAKVTFYQARFSSTWEPVDLLVAREQ
jgi:hypothetical protein